MFYTNIRSPVKQIRSRSVATSADARIPTRNVPDARPLRGRGACVFLSYYGRGMSVDWDWTHVVIDHVHMRVQARRRASRSTRPSSSRSASCVSEAERRAHRKPRRHRRRAADERAGAHRVHGRLTRTVRRLPPRRHRGRARDDGAPGVREQYSSEYGDRYCAAFLLDPDGDDVEAVRREFD